MARLNIDGKDFEVDQEIWELLILLSQERDQLKYELQLAGLISDRTSKMYSGELFFKREYLEYC